MTIWTHVSQCPSYFWTVVGWKCENLWFSISFWTVLVFIIAHFPTILDRKTQRLSKWTKIRLLSQGHMGWTLSFFKWTLTGIFGLKNMGFSQRVQVQIMAPRTMLDENLTRKFTIFEFEQLNKYFTFLWFLVLEPKITSF